jgi:hypothetical protein
MMSPPVRRIWEQAGQNHFLKVPRCFLEVQHLSSCVMSHCHHCSCVATVFVCLQYEAVISTAAFYAVVACEQPVHPIALHVAQYWYAVHLGRNVNLWVLLL